MRCVNWGVNTRIFAHPASENLRLSTVIFQILAFRIVSRMFSRLPTVVLSAIFLMAYATLMSGGRLPGSSVQLGVIACQSILLTILTNYLGWTSIRLCKSKEFETSGKSDVASSDVGGQLHDGIQQLPCAILIVSASTSRLLFANQSALQLFALGWMPQSQLTQRRIEELFQFAGQLGSGTDIQENPILQALQKRERVVAQDVQIRLHNGDTKKTTVTAVPLFDANDQCTSVMALI